MQTETCFRAAAAALIAGGVGMLLAAAILLARAAPERGEVACPVEPTRWSHSIHAYSSQWSDSAWSAAQVVGPPAVFPRGGSDSSAWAAETADGQVEFLEVGFREPVFADGAVVLETDNPGAVTRIEILGAGGERRIIFDEPASPKAEPAYERSVAFPCTEFRVVAVRVIVDAPAVPGWNEIDAIGLRSCRP